MKTAKKVVKWILYFLLIPLTYFIASFVCSVITIDRKAEGETSEKIIYLSTNGVHLDIVIPKAGIDSRLLSGIKHDKSSSYFSFGWGDENFYLNTPTWGDLTFSNAFKAMFLKSSTLMHVTRYKSRQSEWIEIKISEAESEKINAFILNTFDTQEGNSKVLLEGKGYYNNDDFYKAKGSYSCLKTCNTWANSGFKESGLKSCLWTPYDFGLINKYK